MLLAATTAAAALSVTRVEAQRPVYPFSMLEGGIASNAEFQARRAAVSGYSICRIVGPVRPAFLRIPIRRYVSYRLEDGATAFTSRPIALAARESVFVDMRNEIVLRGRCGNCLQTEAPPLKLRREFLLPQEETPAAFVPLLPLPAPPLLPVELSAPDTPLAPLPRSPARPIIPAGPAPGSSSGARPVPATFQPFGPVLPVDRGTNTGPQGGSALPVAAAPEPATWALFGGALLALGLVRFIRSDVRMRSALPGIRRRRGARRGRRDAVRMSARPPKAPVFCAGRFAPAAGRRR